MFFFAILNYIQSNSFNISLSMPFWAQGRLGRGPGLGRGRADRGLAFSMYSVYFCMWYKFDANLRNLLIAYKQRIAFQLYSIQTYCIRF